MLATFDKIQENSPSAKIAYSAAFRRKESQELNTQIAKVYKILSEELLMHSFDIIPNENILFISLNNDSLLLNEKGKGNFQET